MRWSPGLAVLAVIGVLTALSGCGATGGEPAAATSASVPTSGSASTVPTSVPAEPGKVSVRVDAGGYRVGALIHVTVSNGMDRPIYTEDFKTECTIVILQRRRDAGAWSDITGCVLGRPTATVTIEPGRGRAIELNPTSVHLSQGEPAGPAFGRGTYRLKFTYRTDPTAAGEDPLIAYSPDFTVG